MASLSRLLSEIERRSCEEDTGTQVEKKVEENRETC